MSSKLLARIMAVALALPALARGAEEAGTERGSGGLSFIAFKVGGILPTRGVIEGLGLGASAEGVGGYRVSERFAVEFAIGWWDVSTGGPVSIDGLGTISSVVHVTAFPLTVSGVVTVPAGPLRLHGLLGGGIQFSTAQAGLLREHSSSLAVHAGARGDAPLADDVRLGVEVKAIRESADLWNTGSRRVIDTVTAQVALTYSL